MVVPSFCFEVSFLVSKFTYLHQRILLSDIRLKKRNQPSAVVRPDLSRDSREDRSIGSLPF